MQLETRRSPVQDRTAAVECGLTAVVVGSLMPDESWGTHGDAMWAQVFGLDPASGGGQLPPHLTSPRHGNRPVVDIEIVCIDRIAVNNVPKHIMSVTTTANPRVTELRHVLADYDLHHSQPLPETAGPAPAPNAQPQSTTPNPPDWETEWRRVPAYRPIDPSLMYGDRNHVNNEIERNFIRVMFGGVWMQSVSLQIAECVCRRQNF